MAERPSVTGLVRVGLIGLWIVGLLSPATLLAEEKEEVIIRGEDRRPAVSSFEYGDVFRSAEKPEMRTRDIPIVAQTVSVQSISLRKPFVGRGYPPVRSKGTMFKEDSRLEYLYWLIGTGGLWLLILGV